jgi:hypothetical protein
MVLRKILKQQDVVMTRQSFVLEKTKNASLITFLEDLESLIENYLDSVALSDIALNKENNFLGLNQ